MRALVTVRHVTIALFGILIGIVLGGGAYAVSSAAFRYSTPQTGYLMISPGAFTPETSPGSYLNTGATISTTGLCFAAPVNLPHGAKMESLTMWYSKNDASAHSLLLARLSVTDQASVTLATLNGVDTGLQIEPIAMNITSPARTVNNARYYYYLRLCTGSGETFYTARIRYSYKTAGD